MLFPLKKVLVNWVDGMKTGKEHLEQMEDYFIDCVRDATNIQLTGYDFGMLPPSYGDKTSSDFEILERITNHIEVELRQCNAITAGGCRININPLNHSEYLKLNYPFDIEKDKSQNDENLYWDVILSIRPFDRVPTGTPDPDETPLRHPNVNVNYNLIVKPIGQISTEQLGMNHLVIGRITRIGDRFEVDKSYIPPCTSMSSHPALIAYYEQFGKYLNDIETSSHKMLQKINERENNSSIALNIKLVCEDLLRFISSVYFSYRNKGRFYPPVDTLNVFSSLAHTCFVSIDFIPKKKREEMLQYFYEWGDVTPGNLIDLLSEVLEMTYDHHNIRHMMDRTDKLLSVLSFLWIKLCSLEYIGQHKENIVVAEKTQKIESSGRKSEWTILD
ncbi:MAG: hypothetical protein RL662_10 [Bacteroidota bacterium]|jgi:hypothetical protein